MKYIEITKGNKVIVDDDMYEYLNKWKWQTHSDGVRQYATRVETKVFVRKQVHMHRVIINANPKDIVDHINGDTLDNRKENLRLCSSLDNARNRSKHENNTSGFTGVSWHKATNKYRATITVNWKRMHLGLFNNPIDAAKAYDKAAKKYFGEFASLNFKQGE